jgi:hypothetical protein
VNTTKKVPETILKENPMNMKIGVSIVILVSLVIINIFLMIVGKSIPFKMFDIFWLILASWTFFVAIADDNSAGGNSVKENAYLIISLVIFVISALAFPVISELTNELQGGLNKECSSRSPNVNVYESLMANNGNFKGIMIARFVVVTLLIVSMIIFMILFYFRNSYTETFYNFIKTNQYGSGWIMIAIIFGLGIANNILSLYIQPAYDSERVC